LKISNNDKVLELLKSRLEIGQTRYNQDIPLNGEQGRDNLKESLDEVLDLSIYITASIIELNNKKSKPLTIDVHSMQYILRGLHRLHEEAYAENSIVTCNELMELINALKKGSKWCHEDDKGIGQTDNPINKMHDVSPHDPGDENDEPYTKCIPGSNCD
tara:strand:- start:1229 stop:1705 length:477 start_codon:yes stop_codon:yes gene_type:complete